MVSSLFGNPLNRFIPCFSPYLSDQLKTLLASCEDLFRRPGNALRELRDLAAFCVASSAGLDAKDALEALGADPDGGPAGSFLETRPHRFPFWLIWFKNRGPWFAWGFNQLPGPSTFPQKGHLCSSHSSDVNQRLILEIFRNIRCLLN